MPKSKKQKTNHHPNHQPYSSRKNHQSTSNDRNAALSHEEIWDDSALLRSWDDAVKEYQFYHSIHARGEDVDEVLRKAEEAEQAERLAFTSTRNPNGDDPITSQRDRNSSSDEGEISEHEQIEDNPKHDRFKSRYTKTLSLLTEKAPRPNLEDRYPDQFCFVHDWLKVHDPIPDSDMRRIDRDAQLQAIDYWLEELKGTITNEDVNVNGAVEGIPTTTTEPIRVTPDEPVDGTMNASMMAADQTLENVKMAYYWAGYYSGLYDGQRQGQGQKQ